MIRSAASKVMWVGRATVFLVGLAVILALVFGVASTAFAHGGYKGLLHLGHSKAVAKVTTLVGQVATGSALVVSNPSGGSALGLQVNAGQAPLTVNAGAGKATNLDADKVDGLSSNELVRSGLGFKHNSGVGVLSFTDRATVTVEAPAKGFVLINGTVVADTGSSCNPCHAFARVRHDNNQTQSVGVMSSIGNGASTQRDTLPMSWVFPVEAGTNAFTLRTGTYPDPAPIGFFNPTLTAQYVPFGASGTRPSGASALEFNSEAVSPTEGAQRESSEGVTVK